jgi:dTDP-4-amino-4,6-dideoxygalactose transaminase
MNTLKTIPFNVPYLTGKEFQYVQDALKNKYLAGNGNFTKKCHNFFETRYEFKKVLLTTSCTDALEMCSLLLNIQPGDEVILPSYTFVSTALAFVRQGAKIIFADSRSDRPGIDEERIEELVTSKTKAIVVVHYAGVACDMDRIMDIANLHSLFVVEDAAQAIDSYYTGKDGNRRDLGSLGHLAAFSFHETKNIQCGEGGLLVINEEKFRERAEILWEKGTNRSAFYRGETKKYEWLDIGSSFLPSDITAAFLWAQLNEIDKIQLRKKEIWSLYYNSLHIWAQKSGFGIPVVPEFATNNGHMFYLICPSNEKRNKLINKLKEDGIYAVSHYLSLHKSPYYHSKHDGRKLVNSDMFSDHLVRLPLYYELTDIQVMRVVNAIISFNE